MLKSKDKIFETVIATDNAPTFLISDRISEEKNSLLLLGAQYSGTLGKYMEYQSDRYRCHLEDNSGNRFTTFEITKSKNGIIACYSGSYPYVSVYLADVPEFRGISLFQLLQRDASYRGTETTSRYFGMKTSLPFEAFNLSSYHFCIKPFQQGEDFVPPNENSSYETALQHDLKSWYYNKFPNNINRNIPAEPESHRSGWMTMIFDFTDSCGQTIMKVVKLYFMLTDHTFAKTYVPLTRWYSKDMNSNFIAAVGLPGKQILMNLPQIVRAEIVVVCLSLEDAFAMQREVPVDSKTAYTAFVCDGGHYEQVEFSPLKGKNVKIAISNSNGFSLAESCLKAVPLYEYLRDEEGIADIGFILRQVVYPSLQGVFDIDALMKTHRNQKTYVTEGSVVELSEPEFATMLEKAKAEISRKREQSQDFPFWKEADQKVMLPELCTSVRLTDNMISRPYIVGGTVTVIESAPGMGKSCIATAWAASIAGSNDPFFADRYLTRCTRPDGRSNKVGYLVFDADGQLAIDDHRRDFAGNIGDNDANFIQRNMAGDGINYSLPANYNALITVINDIRDNEGVRGQPPDVLFIDTLLAFTQNKAGNAFEVFAKLNKDYPNMAIVVIHHLNLADKTYGGILATMGPRVIIKIYRTEKQKVVDRQPTLHDPFTVEIAKFNVNKIPEDGESFEAQLDDNNHFIVVNPKRSRDEMRRLLIRQYEQKHELTQAEIGRLFGTTDRTIRNWLSGGKNI